MDKLIPGDSHIGIERPGHKLKPILTKEHLVTHIKGRRTKCTALYGFLGVANQKILNFLLTNPLLDFCRIKLGSSQGFLQNLDVSQVFFP